MEKDELVDAVFVLESRVDSLTRSLNALQDLVVGPEQLPKHIQSSEPVIDRLAKLEGTVTPDPTATAYAEKSREQKVRELRIALGRKGRSNGGKASMDYNAVLAVFDNRPSAGHCYKLMELAGHLEGFEYDSTNADTKRLLVNLDAVKDDAVLHAVNNPTHSEAN
ncbi:hypothetical protein [Halomarina rubra]|uniref:Uncharacterized protein n=1 Tax=Halomarina rubra TaxID=2071873 RepID=A0ABD6AZB5_9EURY|nr:hypothetical protein [Halomarina rubra]